MAVSLVHTFQAGVCDALVPSSPRARSAASGLPACATFSSYSVPQASSGGGGGARSPTLSRKVDVPHKCLTIPSTCLALSRPQRRKKLGGGGGPWDGGGGWGGGGDDGGDNGDAHWSDDWQPVPLPLAIIWTLVCTFAVTHSTAYLLSLPMTAAAVSDGAWHQRQKTETTPLESKMA